MLQLSPPRRCFTAPWGLSLSCTRGKGIFSKAQTLGTELILAWGFRPTCFRLAPEGSKFLYEEEMLEGSQPRHTRSVGSPVFIITALFEWCLQHFSSKV